MALPKFLESLSDTSEALREHYKQVDPDDEKGGYELDLDSASEKSRVKEFRSTTLQTRKENEQLTKQLSAFEGVDVEKYKRGQAALQQIENDQDRKLLEEGKVDEVVNRRMQAAVTNWEGKLEAKTNAYSVLEQERNNLRAHVAKGTVRDAVTAAVTKAKVRVVPTAMDDLLNRAHGTFSVDEHGGLIARRNGQEVYGEKGQPLQPDEWVNSLTTAAPHFFEQVGGGGAKGDRKVIGQAGKRLIDPDSPLAIGRGLEDIEAGKAAIGVKV